MNKYFVQKFVMILFFGCYMTGCVKPVSPSDMEPILGNSPIHRLLHCHSNITTKRILVSTLHQSKGIWWVEGCGRSANIWVDNNSYILLDYSLMISMSPDDRSDRFSCEILDVIVLDYAYEVFKYSGPFPEKWYYPNQSSTEELRQVITQSLNHLPEEYGYMPFTILPDQIQLRWSKERLLRRLCVRVSNDNGEPILYSCYDFGEDGSLQKDYLEMCLAETP